MSFLLKDKTRCPRCFSKGIKHFRNCPNPDCEVMLFMKPIQFLQWEADGGIPEWWMYDNMNGWMHRSRLIK